MPGAGHQGRQAKHWASGIRRIGGIRERVPDEHPAVPGRRGDRQIRMRGADKPGSGRHDRLLVRHQRPSERHRVMHP